MLEFKNLGKKFDNFEPLIDINGVVYDGDCISIIGPSGTGKTTLLRCINRLDDATSGDILLNGKSIYSADYNIIDVRQKIGMVFQSFNLFNNLNVIDNITVAPVSLYGKDRKDAHREAIELLERFSLRDKMNSYPHELSGGQKQRVAIMRALAVEPEILLFDEPTSALDPMMVNEVAKIIKDLSSRKLTMLIVTHEMKFVRDVSSRIFYLDEGRVYEEGSPEEIFDNPQKEKTKEFVRRINSFEVSINRNTFDLYLLISDFMKHLSSKNTPIEKVNVANLLLEEITLNEIFANEKDDSNIDIQISSSKDEIRLAYSNLNNFDFELKKTDELTKAIINNKINSRKIDVAKKTVEYII
ncbi:MAG: amino acid ABC transporter ATP-binding protein [Lachnospiraceae bacterium]|nr:amino acid ABC transporter ATP-binding protein [Lachnospiraceae bacterium]